MEKVGESDVRNREFERKFSRELLIKSLIDEGVREPVILDVGAHIGESVRFLRHLFPKSTIHSFEPSASAFAELRELSGDQMHCYHLALTDIDGSVEFFENKISHTNSIHKVNSASRDSLLFDAHRRSGTAIPMDEFNLPTRVPSARLSTFCRQQGIGHIHLLKIDVQGAEIKVLNGAAEALGITDCIILEISFFDYYEHQSSFLEIETVLHPLGFRLFSISEISNNPMNGRTDWVEAIYQRAQV
jgi:FkbM family methyltransferase